MSQAQQTTDGSDYIRVPSEVLHYLNSYGVVIDFDAKELVIDNNEKAKWDTTLRITEGKLNSVERRLREHQVQLTERQDKIEEFERRILIYEEKLSFATREMNDAKSQLELLSDEFVLKLNSFANDVGRVIDTYKSELRSKYLK